MKIEDENPDGKPEGQPAESATPKKAAKPKKEKKQKPSGGVKLPFLLEFMYTLSTWVLIFLALAIILTSFFAGASLYIIVLRTVVALVAVGGLLMLISSQVSSGLLFAAKLEQEETEKKLNEVPEGNHLGNVTLSDSEGSLSRQLRDSLVATNAPLE